MHSHVRFAAVLLLFVWVLPACSSDGGNSIDAVTDVSTDTDSSVPLDTVDQDNAGDTGTAETDTTEARTCLGTVEAASTYTLDGLDGPVEIVVDQWGVPHVFASTERDLFAAQGFIVARYRIVQMHVLRAVTSGRYGEGLLAGPGDVSNDVYMRVLNLRGVAEQMWEGIQANEPELVTMLEAYSSGVNQYLAKVASGDIKGSAEMALLGDIWEWTPVDCLLIGRLQSWDLSFDGRSDKVANYERYMEHVTRWQGGPLDGLFEDMHPLQPATDALSVPGITADRKSTLRTPAVSMEKKFQIDPQRLQTLQETLQSVPLHAYITSPREVGSNDWTISGALSATGFAMVANDTHLSLRNPPVFFEIHLNTTRSGGDLDLAGVTFPGIPSIILGRNAHAAWGGTVYYADVTDVYLESYTPGTPATVELDGAQVAVTQREEVVWYKIPEEGCASWIGSFINGVKNEVEEVDGKCKLTLHIQEVPHHGPVIPGSQMTTEEGGEAVMTWKWTGFKPTNELKTVYKMMRMASPEEFLDALSYFKVGAQNWVYADQSGHIAYAAFCQIPVRKHLAAGDTDHPAYLPYPGTGCCEWEGDVALEGLPQSVDPEQGYIITANGDALGHTLDGNPYNDSTYQGYTFDLGFRVQRVNDLMSDLVDAGTPLTLEHMQAIQGDHRSPMGAALTSHILEAIEAAEAEATDNPEGELAVLATPEVLAAKEKLAAWSFMAESGVGEDATATQKEDAIATSIFNAWLVFVAQELLDNKVSTGFDRQFTAKFLLRLYADPQSLATWDGDLGDSVVWDNPDTAEVETRHWITLKALNLALDFLANPEQVGVPQAGGFGTDDMTQWLWGNLHTIKLTHPLGGSAAIPPESVLPNGYPRAGDNFVVDANDPGFEDTKFTFQSGPAIRNVFILNDETVEAHTIIPGGQDGAVFTPHYADLMPLWVENQTHPLYATEADILSVSESCTLLDPAE